MPGTAVDNPNEWMVNNPNRWIVQEEFADEQAIDYMRQTRDDNIYMPIDDAFDDVVEHIGDRDNVQNITVQNITTDATRLVTDINNTVNTAYWTRTPTEIVIKDEELRERVEQLGAQVKILSDLVGEMKEFVIAMGFNKLMEGESDGEKTER